MNTQKIARMAKLPLGILGGVLLGLGVGDTQMFEEFCELANSLSEVDPLKDLYEWKASIARERGLEHFAGGYAVFGAGLISSFVGRGGRS